MIVSFSCKETKKVSVGQYSKLWSLNIRRVAMRRLDYLDAAIDLNDLGIPPSNRLHPLKGSLEGYHSININMKWRIIFIWRDGNAHHVEITDYH